MSSLGSGRIFGGEFGHPLGEVEDAFEILDDFGFETEGDETVGFSCGETFGEVLIGFGGEVFDSGFGSDHFGGDFGISIHEGADGPVEVAANFPVKLEEHFLGGIADLKVCLKPVIASLGEAAFDHVADVRKIVGGGEVSIDHF